MGRLRVLVVDDHEIVRRGIRALLEASSAVDIAGEAANGREAIRQTKTLKPDVVLLDIAMPDLNGLEVIPKILKIQPKARILVLTMDDSGKTARDVIAAGAGGLVLKSDAPDDLLQAIEAVSKGQPFISPRVTKMILGTLAKTPTAEAPASDLTPREREVLRLLAEGHSSKEVAAVLGISPRTVDAHRATIMHKLNLHSLSELIHFAIRNNIVRI
jgi:DNA-binding NarL/FixJ family response regulator